jgi:hypothetical protein
VTAKHSSQPVTKALSHQFQSIQQDSSKRN